MSEDLKTEAYAALAGPATRETRLEEALQTIEAMQPKAVERLRAGNYVFDKSPIKKPVTEAERWQELAFWLYTDLAEANLICRQALEREE